jgi:hypothetical protein
MSNWNTNWFLVIRARERQQGFLCEAERDHAVWSAQARRKPEARAYNLRTWIGQILGPRTSKRSLQRCSE